MAQREVVDSLAALSRFAGVPREELEWLAARGEVRAYAAGTILLDEASPSDEMYIILAGRASVYMNRGGAWRKSTEAGPGQVVGAIPYSRMQFAPGRLIVEDDADLLALRRTHFADLQRDCHALTTALVHEMIDRTRSHQMAELHEDRLQALGRLAAGLAHELNNPASAAARSALTLADLVDRAEHGARALAEAPLGGVQLAALDAVRTACAPSATSSGTIELAEREDQFAEWLERHGIDPVGADTLAASEVRVADLERLASVLPPSTLEAAVRWVTCGRAARALAEHVAAATGRVHALVDAVKRFTLMDRESVPGEIDLAQGLADTLTMLENKSRTAGVEVRFEVAPDLPRVYGFGSEINQVWEKLIDNAIDAAGRGGHVSITASSRGEDVVVFVTDDGAGIPSQYRARVFEPFFTTKPVGQATGLGLHLARRVVLLHHGDVDFTSEPGRTTFQVRLPVSGAMPPRAEP